MAATAESVGTDVVHEESAPKAPENKWQLLDGSIVDKERSQEGPTITYRFSKEEHVNRLLQNIRILWQRKEMIDVRIIGSNRKVFPYHSVLMAGSSSIFRKILASEQVQLFQGTLAPRDVESIVLENLLNCLYKPDEFCKSFADRSKLLDFSSYFGLEEMIVNGIIDCTRLLDNWNEMFLQRCLTFTKLEAEDSVFPCHGLILTACSPVLKQMNIEDEGDMPLPYNTIKLEGFSSSTMKTLLKFLYTAELNLAPDTVADVLISSCKLRFLSAAKGSCKYVIDTITPDISFNQRQLAKNAFAIKEDDFCDALVKDVEKYIVDNFQQVIDTDEFCNLATKDDIIEFLMRAQLDDIEKHTILQALFKWCECDHDGRLQELSKIYALVSVIKEPQGLSNVLTAAAAHSTGEKAFKPALVANVIIAELRTTEVQTDQWHEAENSSSQQPVQQNQMQNQENPQHQRQIEHQPRGQVPTVPANQQQGNIGHPLAQNKGEGTQLQQRHTERKK